MRNVSYDVGDPDALLDVFFPSALGEGETLPVIVWVHGGAWVSGGRWQMSEYASILAAKGYAVAVVGYSLAPEAIYPTALNQVNRALGFLGTMGGNLHVDETRLILAGDSAGAQLAAQLANAITSPDYARAIGLSPTVVAGNLRGVALFSGAYDLALVDLRGVTGLFLRSVLWAYTGTSDFATDNRFAAASVIHFLSASFPPAFISAGDADPLLPHSLALAESLTALGIDVHSLFFGANGPTGHNYQFDLDTETGREALAELSLFLERVSR
jgi:acetyl esterase